MMVLSYVGPAALVLALSWAVVKLTRMAVGTPAIAAVTAVVVFALIAVTPLCGFMFDCGCDWPGRGSITTATSSMRWPSSNALGATTWRQARSRCLRCSAPASSWPIVPHRWERAPTPASPSACSPAPWPFISFRLRLESLPLSPRDIRCLSRLSQHCAGRRSQFSALSQAMIFQISSSVLKMSPKCGIGPTTFSEPLRAKPCF